MIIMLPVTSVRASIHYEDYELPIMGEEVAIISQSSSLNVNVGDIAKYSVKAKGVGLTYQWQVKLKNSANWTNASGNKDTWCFKVASVHDGMQVRCVVKDAIGETAISKAVNCIIDENLKIVSQPGSVEAEEVTEVVVVDVETYVCAESKLGQYLPCESSVHVEVFTNTFLVVVVEGCDWVFQSVIDVALIEEKAS